MKTKNSCVHGKLGRSGATNQIEWSDLNSNTDFEFENANRSNVVKGIARQNDIISDVAYHVDIFNQMRLFYLKSQLKQVFLS